MSQVSSFLGGIFFASILILIQLKELFNHVLLSFEILGFARVDITPFYVIAIPLALGVVTFIFSAIRFAGACSIENSGELNNSAGPAYVVFRVGFVSMLVSLTGILLVADVLVGALGLAFMILAVIYLENK